MNNYLFRCELSADIGEYYKGLSEKVRQEFNLPPLPRHKQKIGFTLKYRVEGDEKQLGELESKVKEFCRSHKKSRLTIGEIACFDTKETVYAKIEMSEEAKQTFQSFYDSIKSIGEWVGFYKYDIREKEFFHITIAEGYDESFPCDNIVSFLQKNQKTFNAWFDNVTILKQTGGTTGSSRVYEEHAKYMLGQ